MTARLADANPKRDAQAKRDAMRAHSQQRAFAAGSARWAWKVTKIKSYARQQREIERESERKHRQESVQRVERMRRFKDAGKEAQLRERNRECRARERVSA